MFEPITPESKLHPSSPLDLSMQQERLAEVILDDEQEWENLTETVNFDMGLYADLDACLKDLVDKRRHCLPDSSAVQAAVNGLVHVYERAAMMLAKERIK